MKEYELIKTKDCKLVLVLNEKAIDYYTDIYIEMRTIDNCIKIFKDNLLELKNIVKNSIDQIKILEKIDDNALGYLLNEYYKNLYEEISDNKIILDNNGYWIGEKYQLFISCDYVTWLYKKDGEIILRVSPVFSHFEEDNYLQEYYDFISKYKDLFIFKVSIEQIDYMRNIIIRLYEEFLG